MKPCNVIHGDASPGRGRRRMALFLVLLLSGGVCHGAGRSLADLRAVYDQEVGRIEQDYDEAVAATRRAYAQYVEQAIERAQAAGDLDALLVLREERTRLAQAGTIPEAADRDGGHLRQSRLLFAQRKADAGLAKNRATISLIGKYVSGLERMQQGLVRGGRIDEALAVKKEITRVEFIRANAAASLREELARRPKPEPRSPVAVPPPGRETGPVLHYSFDDEGASIKDAGGNGHDGEIHGTTYADGIQGRGMRFTTADTYALCKSPDLSLKGWKHLTVAFWFNMSRYTTYGRVLSRSVIGKGGGAFGFTIGGRYGSRAQKCSFGVRFKDGKGAATSLDTFAKLNTWYHVAGVYDGTRVVYYVDGKEAASTPVDAELRHAELHEDPGVALVIGKCGTRWSWRDTHLCGTMDELMLFDRALSKMEIARLAESGR